MVPLTERFHAFGAQHFTLLTLFLVGCVVLVTVGRRRGDDEKFRRILAMAIPCFTVPLQLAQLRPSDFDLATSLPVNLCDIAWVVASFALWTRRPWAVALTYYWGLTLSTQGIITPDLAHGFPAWRFFGFWGLHLLIVWAAVYLTAAGNLPSWRGYRTTLVVTAAWAVAAMMFNAAVGSNYGYLNAKPRNASALDLLGPWPLYVGTEMLILAVGWALITWPWVRARKESAANDLAAPD